MKEKEVKVLNIDKEKIEKKLIKIDSKLVKDEFQYNYIFDKEDRYLKNEHQGYLRIRRTTADNKNEKIELTLKRNISKENIRENIENNLNIDNVEEGIKILGILGYKLIHKGIKHRKSYKYEGILFEIDTWDKETYPYTYLEIEVEKEENLEKALELLDIDKKNITKKSIEELREEEFGRKD